jgi:hypothetical protein
MHCVGSVNLELPGKGGRLVKKKDRVTGDVGDVS